MSSSLSKTLRLLGQKKNSALKILDLGVGSGCLLLSLLHELPYASGIGVDLSFGALQCAQENAQNLHLHNRALFVQGRWGDALKGPFDIITSNPPYIQTSTLPFLDQNVISFDPLLALDGGEDGLNAYRYLLPQVKKYLSPTGHFLLEIGSGQASCVNALLRHENYSDICLYQDLEHRARVFSCSYSFLF